MGDYSLLIQLVSDILGTPRKRNGNQCSYDCPVCSHDIKGLDEGDGKGNLDVQFEKGIFSCWSCYQTHGTSGSLFKLVKRWGTRKHVEQLRLYLPDRPLSFNEPPREDEEDFDVELPKEYIPLTDVAEGLKLTHHYRRAMDYLTGRGITQAMIDKFDIGFCYDGKYAGRIILPSYDQWGEVNYFVSRTYVGDMKKYDNPRIRKEAVIVNEHLIDWSRDVYLVEGMIDSMFVDNSIAMLGKYCSDLLWERLYNEAAADVYILLDGDAWYASEMLYAKLNGGRLHKRVKVIKLPHDKDIADLRGRFEQDWILELEPY